MTEPVRVRMIAEFPGFVISADGRIQGVSGQWLKLSPDSNGYPRLMVRRDGRKRYVHAHTLVCTAFHGPKPSPDHQVAHNNGVRADLREANLRWDTVAGNHADKKIHETDNSGIRHVRSRLSEAAVREIRRVHSYGGPIAHLAERYGVSKSVISAAALGKTYKNVPLFDDGRWPGDVTPSDLYQLYLRQVFESGVS